MREGGEIKLKFSLKELRARKNKTQKEVAEAVGVSETTYRDWEHRPGIIMLNNACKLAAYFEVGVDEIKV